MRRTYWLSFVDPDKPEGERFLGVCVVDVTERERKTAAALLPLVKRGFFTTAAETCRDEEAPWIAAAVRKAHLKNCNPGGQVGAADITRAPDQILREYPRNRLLTKAEIRALP